MNIGNQHFLGIVFKKKEAADIGYKDKLPHLIEMDRSVCYCTHDIDNFNIARGHLKANDAKEIVSKCIDNQVFTVNGKWSIATLDKYSGSITLIRDVLGISPIYYFKSDDIFAFSSCVHRLLELDFVITELNLSASHRFLIDSKIDDSEFTLFENVKEVNECTALTLSLGNWSLDSRSYRKSHVDKFKLNHPYPKIVSENRSSIIRFVSEFYESDYSRSALFLSGGLDSSCLASVLVNNDEISKFFTISYENMAIDESRYADAIATLYPNIDWHKLEPKGAEFIQDVEGMHRQIDFPTLSTGTYNQFRLFGLCEENGVERVWDGLGADALYGGHDYYRHQLFLELVSKLKLNQAMTLLKWRNKPVKDLMLTIKSAIKSRIVDSPNLSRLVSSIIGEMNLYNPDFLSDFVAQSLDREKQNVEQTRIKMNHDFYHGVRPLSRYTDRLASHQHIDICYPFSENLSLAQAISQVHTDQLFYEGRSKAILRDSFQKELPNMISNRKDKKGLPSPNNLWIDDYKENWIKYFSKDLGHIYDLKYIHKNYSSLFNIKSKSENYRMFKHISFAIWA